MQSLKEQAFTYIKDLILQNKLTYGEIYSETKISETIGISRTPCRDAIQVLAQEGYLDIIPSKGFSLHKLTKKDIDETYQLRYAIECFCTRHLTKHAKEPDSLACFDELDGYLAQMKEIIASDHSVEEYWKYDCKFHTKIIESIGNKMFMDSFEHYINKISRMAMASLQNPDFPQRMEQATKEHADILNTMRSGNLEQIAEVTMIHMENPYHINMNQFL